MTKLSVARWVRGKVLNGIDSKQPWLESENFGVELQTFLMTTPSGSKILNSE